MPSKEKESEDNIGTVLARAQLKMGKALKSADNPYFSSKYAGLDEVIEACRSVLNEEGIAVAHITDFTPERTELKEDGTKVHYPRQDFVTCRLIYKDQALQAMMPLRCAKDDMQSLGSAITYARRYTLQSMVCLSTGEDDDGNSAVGEEKMEAKVGRRRNTRIATPAKPQEELVTDDFLK
tara:strand:+ start:2026 stop:2565 length:540 start_codon:yes stop_codon:yes gene_type:complete